jgi:hypothetical protein
MDIFKQGWGESPSAKARAPLRVGTASEAFDHDMVISGLLGWLAEQFYLRHQWFGDGKFPPGTYLKF